eukprot:CAMPEP_0119329020 /NCGR_PEP_ID=MMETSP1333-20130426/74821_1 /TAXON_ID=418940 /ORGANISM="Scyphosphaera apsteinii, Strain RCC1455" /LENGTH=356 /DNA_ID=CAMNT_0007338033 /DNA_START=156 /DNA_END=1226 /DNA_ORIENTATION=-
MAATALQQRHAAYGTSFVGALCCVAWLVWKHGLRRRKQALALSTSDIAGDDFVFGIGSLIECQSRLSSMSNPCRAAVRVLYNGDIFRGWHFRSSTGFTAIAGRRLSGSTNALSGVCFPAGTDMASLDARERGYHRVLLQCEHIDLVDSDRNCECDCAASGCTSNCFRGKVVGFAAHLQRAERFDATPPRIWIYLPDADSLQPATADFPICQTYIDVVLHGCLAWGGEQMAREYILSTDGWSPFWLNDAPQSRRPWLHRKPTWRKIDELLQAFTPLTHFDQRCHSEEYAAVARERQSLLIRKNHRSNSFTTRPRRPSMDTIAVLPALERLNGFVEPVSPRGQRRLNRAASDKFTMKM